MGSCLSKPRPSLPPRNDQLVLSVQHVDEIIEEVFQNDLLLDLILTRVLLKPLEDGKRNGTFSKDEARVLRQVCRRWMVCVSSLFFRAGEPLLHLELTNEHFFPDAIQDTMMMRGLQESTLYAGSSSGHRIILPPISLSLTKVNRLRRSFFNTLMALLHDSLFQLRIRDTCFSNQLVLPTLPSNLQFMLLQKVTLEYSDRVVAEANYVARFDAFIQSILDQTVMLQEFSYEVEHSKYNRFPTVPVHVFPQTLTHLETFTVSGNKLKPATITSSLQPPLYHLSTLNIRNMLLDYKEDLYKLLDVVRASLEHLCVECLWRNDHEFQIEMKRIPVLPQLKTFVLEGPFIISGMETIKEPKFPSVQSIMLPLTGSIQGSWTPVPMSSMIRIQSNFPCIAHMNVLINWDSKDGLKNLFRVMGDQLKTLTVEFMQRFMDFNNQNQEILVANEWNVLFLGTTHHKLLDTDNLKRFIMDEEYLHESIRNLKNLQQLTIIGCPFTPVLFNNFLPWGCIFLVAFDRMPKLKHLTIGGFFHVDEETVQSWVDIDGRTINYKKYHPW